MQCRLLELNSVFFPQLFSLKRVFLLLWSIKVWFHQNQIVLGAQFRQQLIAAAEPPLLSLSLSLSLSLPPSLCLSVSLSSPLSLSCNKYSNIIYCFHFDYIDTINSPVITSYKIRRTVFLLCPLMIKLGPFLERQMDGLLDRLINSPSPSRICCMVDMLCKENCENEIPFSLLYKLCDILIFHSWHGKKGGITNT